MFCALAILLAALTQPLLRRAKVLATMNSVYGVRLPHQFTRWVDAFNVDLLDYGYPSGCIGSMSRRLITSALWPVIALTVFVAAIAAFRAVVSEKSHGGKPAGSTAKTTSRVRQKIFTDSLYATLLLTYSTLPTVARNIFLAKQCESFQYSALTAEFRSFLVADPGIRCSSSDTTYSQLQTCFWVFFIMWPVAIPAMYVKLLRRVRPRVLTGHTSEVLAHATRFLWRDYNAAYLFWEIADTARKLILTSFVLFVDTNLGSRKLLRTCIATFVSSMYLAVLALARPFKRDSNLYLACTSNLLLICCFMSGIVVKLCEDWDCYAIVGFNNSVAASSIVILLSAAMLSFILADMAYKAYSATDEQIIMLRKTQLRPELTMASGCKFHGFISHAWCAARTNALFRSPHVHLGGTLPFSRSRVHGGFVVRRGTGQDQTHTIVRQLGLLMPNVEIWLDVRRPHTSHLHMHRPSILFSAPWLPPHVSRMPSVVAVGGQVDELDDVGKLEECVEESAVFVIFLSVGYFRSANCRRELYAALGANKPLIAVREDDTTKGGASRSALEDECLESCGERAREVAEKVFVEEPTVWVRVSEFQNESLKVVAYHLLRAMPGYEALEWLRGPEDLCIPGELGPLSFKAPLRLLVCGQNEGAYAVALELQEAASEEPPNKSSSHRGGDSTRGSRLVRGRSSKRPIFHQMAIIKCDSAELTDGDRKVVLGRRVDSSTTAVL